MSLQLFMSLQLVVSWYLAVITVGASTLVVSFNEVLPQGQLLSKDKLHWQDSLRGPVLDMALQETFWSL